MKMVQTFAEAWNTIVSLVDVTSAVVQITNQKDDFTAFNVEFNRAKRLHKWASKRWDEKLVALYLDGHPLKKWNEVCRNSRVTKLQVVFGNAWCQKSRKIYDGAKAVKAGNMEKHDLFLLWQEAMRLKRWAEFRWGMEVATQMVKHAVNAEGKLRHDAFIVEAGV